MRFRRLRLIGEAVLWVPFVLIVETIFHFAVMVRDLVRAFLDEWKAHT